MNINTPMNDATTRYESLSDTQLAQRAYARDGAAIRLITTRNNQRLFRTAWSVLRNHADAEDVVQETYLKAFAAMNGFTGQSTLSTWLTRITMNSAIDRQRSIARRKAALDKQDIALMEHYRSNYASLGGVRNQPNSQLARSELSRVLKLAIARLPDQYRMVFVLREVEAMSVAETADVLEIGQATVRSRLFRARRLLRRDLEAEYADIAEHSVTFAGADCEAMTSRIITALDCK
ncbi:RNA polymerase sigma factor [Parasphingorhabdus sp. JC815]|uniref:RNA polymerase sigma factor n=1 Tax=Parasphingorhabdus sp. JC815 TaxID=3232140 RepID=UPI00345B3F66